VTLGENKWIFVRGFGLSRTLLVGASAPANRLVRFVSASGLSCGSFPGRGRDVPIVEKAPFAVLTTRRVQSAISLSVMSGESSIFRPPQDHQKHLF
jgi:hypothetical protein